MDLWQLSATELVAAYRAGDASPIEAVEERLGRIERLDPEVGAFRQVLPERAMAEARARTDELARGEWKGSLHGVPVAIKELFDVEGAVGCYGSKIFLDRVSSADAGAVARWRGAGAIVLGVTRSHEFGWGITNQHAELGSTRNPWNIERVPGGSSGGSAAAVAMGMVPLALGSDTGGSIRIPACFCGVAGLKPTYGRVSKLGAVALAPSLDHPGPLAANIADLALGLAAMSGFDADDPTTLSSKPPAESVVPAVAGVRVGVAPDLHLTPLRTDHRARFDAAVEAASAGGAMVVEVAIPEAAAIRPAFGTIQMAEAHHVHSATLGTFPGRADDYGDDVRRRLEMASKVTVGDYLSAQETARHIRRRFLRVFENIDVLVTPITAGGPSTVLRPNMSTHGDEEIPFRDLVMDYTVPQNLTGLPSCAVPNGLDDDGLPLGIQVTAQFEQESTALDFAAGLAEVLETTRSWPDLAFG